MSRAQRATQLISAACHQLQQWRGAKAVTTKLNVELLKVRTQALRALSLLSVRIRLASDRLASLPGDGELQPPAPPPLPSSRRCRFRSRNSTRLAVRLQDVKGVGPAGKLAKVNHGYARNFLVPNRLASVVPLPSRRRRAARGAEAAASSSSTAQAQPSLRPVQLSLERQQQQFDKLMKSLTTTVLVRSSVRAGVGWTGDTVAQQQHSPGPATHACHSGHCSV